MEEQTPKLEASFKQFLIEGDKEPKEYGNELILGEC